MERFGGWWKTELQALTSMWNLNLSRHDVVKPSFNMTTFLSCLLPLIFVHYRLPLSIVAALLPNVFFQAFLLIPIGPSSAKVQLEVLWNSFISVITILYHQILYLSSSRCFETPSRKSSRWVRLSSDPPSSRSKCATGMSRRPAVVKLDAAPEITQRES